MPHAQQSARTAAVPIQLRRPMVWMMTGLALSLSVAAESQAEQDAPPAARAGAALHEQNLALEPFLGIWKIEAEWATGEPLIGYATHQAVLGGSWVESATIVSAPGGGFYERYHSFMRVDPDDPSRIEAHTFTYDGGYTASGYDIEKAGEQIELVNEWGMGDSMIRERFGPDGNGRLLWKVWLRGPDTDRFDPIMDDAWERSSADAIPALPPAECHESIRPLAAFIGDWAIEASWAWGATLAAEQSAQLIMRGRFLHSTTIVSDNGGAPYERYRTVFGLDADGLYARSFQSDGVAAVARIEHEAGEFTMTSEGQPPIRQTIRFAPHGDEYRWLVSMIPAAGNPPAEPMMDGVWRRVIE